MPSRRLDHRQDDAPTREGEAAAGRTPPQGASAQILALQSSFGNAAVARAIAAGQLGLAREGDVVLDAVGNQGASSEYEAGEASEDRSGAAENEDPDARLARALAERIAEKGEAREKPSEPPAREQEDAEGDVSPDVPASASGATPPVPSTPGGEGSSRSWAKRMLTALGAPFKAFGAAIKSAFKGGKGKEKGATPTAAQPLADPAAVAAPHAASGAPSLGEPQLKEPERFASEAEWRAWHEAAPRKEPDMYSGDAEWNAWSALAAQKAGPHAASVAPSLGEPQLKEPDMYTGSEAEWRAWHAAGARGEPDFYAWEGQWRAWHSTGARKAPDSSSGYREWLAWHSMGARKPPDASSSEAEWEAWDNSGPHPLAVEMNAPAPAATKYADLVPMKAHIDHSEHTASAPFTNDLLHVRYSLGQDMYKWGLIEEHEQRTVQNDPDRVREGLKKVWGWSDEDVRKYYDASSKQVKDSKVDYITSEQDLKKFVVRGGATLQYGDPPQPFDTANMRSKASGPGFAIFVMDAQGNIYAGQHRVGLFHHSSFLAGRAVAAAGEMKVSGGTLVELTGKSGHYVPTDEQMHQMLQELAGAGVALAGVTIRLWTVVGGAYVTQFYDAADFLANKRAATMTGEGSVF